MKFENSWMFAFLIILSLPVSATGHGHPVFKVEN